MLFLFKGQDYMVKQIESMFIHSCCIRKMARSAGSSTIHVMTAIGAVMDIRGCKKRLKSSDWLERNWVIEIRKLNPRNGLEYMLKESRKNIKEIVDTLIIILSAFIFSQYVYLIVPVCLSTCLLTFVNLFKEL